MRIKCSKSLRVVIVIEEEGLRYIRGGESESLTEGGGSVGNGWRSSAILEVLDSLCNVNPYTLNS